VDFRPRGIKFRHSLKNQIGQLLSCTPGFRGVTSKTRLYSLCIRSSRCQFINNLFTMDDDSTGDNDIHAVDWDDDTDMMAAAVLVIVNMNEMMMDSIMDTYEQEQERERIQ
jgi:hypothetical protein